MSCVHYTERLLDYLLQYYSPDDFPLLLEDYYAWRKTKPLLGLHIVEATPLYRNTLCKFLPLLAAGAKITVSVFKHNFYDKEILGLLSDFAIDFASDKSHFSTLPADIIMDCGGGHANISSNYGYIELTQSGLAHYKNTDKTVFLADQSACKLLETTFGTGESFVRAMAELGYDDLNKKIIVIFGAGKVGKGIAYFCQNAGAEVFLVDDSSKCKVNENTNLIDWRDFDKQKEILEKAFCIVTATGVKNALKKHPIIPDLIKSKTLFANMGVEDEFGEAIKDKKRILNNNLALNFSLEEPTHLSLIEPIMALSNRAMLKIKNKEFPPGLIYPPKEMDQEIFNTLKTKGKLQKHIHRVMNDE